MGGKQINVRINVFGLFLSLSLSDEKSLKQLLPTLEAWLRADAEAAVGRTGPRSEESRRDRLNGL